MTAMTSPPDRLDFDLAVWEHVKSVPEGRVTTYGAVARAIPAPPGVLEKTYAAFGARWVGSAMARCPDDVPWHRVLNSRGEVSVRSEEARTEQWERLRLEGVMPGENGRIDLRTRGWDGAESPARGGREPAGGSDDEGRGERLF